MSAVQLAEQNGYVLLTRVMMTPRQVQLVQQSLPTISSNANEIATLFYERLFTIQPRLRNLFLDDLAKQKKKLIGMIAFLVVNLSRISQVSTEIHELGRRHHGYEITADDYADVGEALIWTFDNILGPQFTPDLRAAWIAVYGMVSTVMQERAETPRDQKKFFADVVTSVLDSYYGISERAEDGDAGVSLIDVDTPMARKRRST
jgi:hemoglobin-like flavoprotein